MKASRKKQQKRYATVEDFAVGCVKKGVYRGTEFWATDDGKKIFLRCRLTNQLYVAAQIRQSQIHKQPSLGGTKKKYVYGHKYVTICVNEKPTTVTVSKLVAIAHVPNPNPETYDIVMHLDETLDEEGFQSNAANNLKWGTRTQNHEDCCAKNRFVTPKFIMRPEKQCPHCGVWFKPLNYGRWHGDKCKKKPRK